ncbi:MAG TPA: hypothetical protein VGH54_23445 [Mycobacterium sp.]|jgi:hypothetical protein|uniref:hypothetical protein n=1 Tax=Mycobacterium sp. TaxID=1785 RepID=UPI002F4172B2
MAMRSAYTVGYEFGKHAGYSRPDEPYGYTSDDADGDGEPQQILYAKGYRQGYLDGQEQRRAKLAA